jgi:release factor glutamine methyltransferase
VTLTDVNVHALNLAKENAEILHANVRFLKNDLLGRYGTPITIIIANLPYVDRSWEVSADTRAEPDEALYAERGGLSLIYRLLDQAHLLLEPNGHILLESDPRQHSDIIEHAKKLGFHHEKTEGFITVFSNS